MFNFSSNSSIMEKQIDINFTMVQGLFLSEHTLDIDHDAIVKEVLESRESPENHPMSKKFRDDSFQMKEVHHTFYEDTNMFDKTVNKLLPPIQNIINSIFGQNRLIFEEVWGHIIPPGDQTMVHNHTSNFKMPGLSFAYYPHVVPKGGNIYFLAEVNGSKTTYEHEVKQGDLLLFSQDLWHYTPRNGSDQNRVTVSGNLFGTADFYSELQQDDYARNPYWHYNGRP